MSDQEFVIELDEDTEGHKSSRGVVEAQDTEWLGDRIRRDGGKASFRVVLDDSDEADTEGHGAGATLRVRLADGDDTEGHAIAIHFPTRSDADAFRRRLLMTGVLAGTIALGTAGGIGLSALQSDDGAGAAATTTTQSQVGPMDAHEAPAFTSRAAAEGAYADRLNGLAAAAAQTGPMDAHEAPAFDSRAAAESAYADRLSGLAAAAQVGPMDAHEAPAFTGPAADDEASDVSTLGGPTPR